MNALLDTIFLLKNVLIKFRFFLALVVLFLSAMSFSVFGQTQTESPLPKPTNPVSDFAEIIDDTTETQLNKRLKDLQSGTNPPIEIAVVTIKSLEGKDIFDYSLAVARGWGIGSKLDDNPSLLLLVSTEDRKYFTQTSRDAEGDLPDGLVGQYQRQYLIPAFRQGQFGKGISETVEAYIRRFGEMRGFDPNTLGKVERKKPRANNTDATTGGFFVCCIASIILFVIILIISSAFRGRGGRGGGSGGGFVPPVVIWSGGSFGGSSGSDSGWGSSGGDSWGGFGGGGDFGGGGAGGDW